PISPVVISLVPPGLIRVPDVALILSFTGIQNPSELQWYCLFIVRQRNRQGKDFYPKKFAADLA
ncbi:hypothetical protein ACU6Z3_28155, partial [Klebsiella aerogenes]